MNTQYIKNLADGDVFTMNNSDTLYIAESVYTEAGTTRVVYRLVSDYTVRNVTALPALTTVKVMVFN